MIDQRRKRILLVTRNLPPLVGGMERLNWHMAEELAKVAEVRVVAPAGSTAPESVGLREVPLRPLGRFLFAAQRGALREARSWKPDVVLAGSGLTALPALLAARAVGASAAAYVHGLDLTAGHPLYRALWYPALRRMDRIVANSAPTAALAQSIGIVPERIGIVHPGVRLPTTLPDEQAIGAFRREHALGNRTVLLSVGRLSERKGLREFIERALPRIVAAEPDVLLLVVGDVPKNALLAGSQSPESIRATARHAGVEGNVRLLGLLNEADLELAYSSADVHVFPIRQLANDPEGFGMVAVEAAAHGLPTVAFAVGGVVDAVEDGTSGCLVMSGDYVALAEAVTTTLTRRDDLRASCLDFARRFTWPEIGAQLGRQICSCQ
ncbi:glycosyltransferase family 4 protein [Frateuria soli]|uniref:glycosyltransferase family 4 protein n=1 Tax=Frateuria soli TaxID=1542730 RepID=UPI001E2F054E|nr:glycosyltransferase family 4 protein [Frateuria soli]UGB38977.1 glycosyltransferase family 4 protein [Frateuria soli]